MALPAGIEQLGTFQGAKGDRGNPGTFADAFAIPVAADETNLKPILSGPESARVITFKTPRGLPGVNAVPTDEAMSTYIGAPDTQSGAAVQDRIDLAASPNMASLLTKFSADTAALQLEAYMRDRAFSVPTTPINCWYGYQIAARWKAALDRVRTGAGPAKILCIGDSTTAGMGTSTENTVANANAWPAVLARLLHRNVGKATYGLSIPPATGHDSEDNRWGLGVGWARASIAGLGIGGRRNVWAGVAGGSGALTFLDNRFGVNAYDVYYTKNASAASGTFTAQVGTGTPVVVNTNAAAGIGKVTVVGTSVSTAIPVTIRNTGASGTVYIIGVEPHHATDHSIRVANAGASGANSTSWLEQSGVGNAWNVIGFLPVYQPDLTIIDLGINDSPGTSVVDYVARMKTLADAATAAGSAVLFKTMIPSDPTSGRVQRESEFVQGLIGDLSSAYAVLDLFNHYGSYGRNAARGWMADGLHPADGLYYDEAEKVAEFLFRYSGHNG